MGFTVSEEHFKSVSVNNQTISADHLIMAIEYAPKEYVKSSIRRYLSRGILITDKSVMKSEKEHLTLLFYPPEGEKNAVTVIELGTLTGTSPKDLCMVKYLINGL